MLGCDLPVDGELHVAMHRLRHTQEIYRTNPKRAPGPDRPEWIESINMVMIPKISQIQHSCDPNCNWNFEQPYYDQRDTRGLFVFKTVKALKPGDVLTIDFQEACFFKSPYSSH